MQQYLLFLCVVFIVPLVFIMPSYQSTSPSGSVELDELSFDKVISKFDASLVKFDVAFPYGDKHDAFVALAKDAKDVDELLIAEVGVKDYGEKDNEALAKKYGATKDNFPIVKLFLKNKDPLTFDEKKGFTSDELRRFIRENTGLYLSLPGCLRELDYLAIKFMKMPITVKRDILSQVGNMQEDLNGKDSVSGNVYKTIMEKVIEKGDDFVDTEYERVKKILSGKLSDVKKKELEIRLNILQTFKLTNMHEIIGKQEL